MAADDYGGYIKFFPATCYTFPVTLNANFQLNLDGHQVDENWHIRFIMKHRSKDQHKDRKDRSVALAYLRILEGLLIIRFKALIDF